MPEMEKAGQKYQNGQFKATVIKVRDFTYM